MVEVAYLIAALIHIIIVILIVSSLYGMRVHLKNIAEYLRRIAQNLDKLQQHPSEKKDAEERRDPIVGEATGSTVQREEISREGYGVLLESFGKSHQKADVIVVVSDITGLSLKEAKEKVESAPVIIQEGISREAAEEIKERLEVLGAVVEIL